MDIQTYNYLCGASNLPPQNCLFNNDYILEKIKGGNESNKSFFYINCFKDKSVWKELIKWISKHSTEKNIEKIIVKLIKKKEDDITINDNILKYLIVVDPYDYQVERKKKILETISKKLDIRNFKIITYCDPIYTEVLKKIGIDVWRADLEKNVYDLCIYDDVLVSIPKFLNINMKDFLKKEKYYYYINEPDINTNSKLYGQIIKYTIMRLTNMKTKIEYINMISKNLLLGSFLGEFKNEKSTSHLCKIIYEKEDDFINYELILNCKPNPNYIYY